MTESMRKLEAQLDAKFAEQNLYKGIEMIERSAQKFAGVQAELLKLTAALKTAATLRANIDAVIFKAYGITRAAGESTYDALARAYGLRSDQVQLYVEMRNRGTPHAEAERAALARQPQ